MMQPLKYLFVAACCHAAASPARSDDSDVIEHARVSHTGAIIRNVIHSTPGRAAKRGDVIAFSIDARRGEHVRLQVHLYCFPHKTSLGEGDAAAVFKTPVSKYDKVPASSDAFKSASEGNVASVSTSFHALSDEAYDVSVFFPYEAALFDKPGYYLIRYRVRVLINGKVEDACFCGQPTGIEATNNRRLKTYTLGANQEPSVEKLILESAKQNDANN